MKYLAVDTTRFTVRRALISKYHTVHTTTLVAVTRLTRNSTTQKKRSIKRKI